METESGQRWLVSSKGRPDRMVCRIHSHLEPTVEVFFKSIDGSDWQQLDLDVEVKVSLSFVRGLLHLDGRALRLCRQWPKCTNRAMFRLLHGTFHGLTNECDSNLEFFSSNGIGSWNLLLACPHKYSWDIPSITRNVWNFLVIVLPQLNLRTSSALFF